MAHITFSDVSIEFPIFNATGRSLTSSILKVATGGKLDADPNGRVLVKALTDVSFSLREGDKVALLGHNGAGKSTMLRALGRVYAPTKGTAEIVGEIGSLQGNFPVQVGELRQLTDFLTAVRTYDPALTQNPLRREKIRWW